MQLGLRKKDNFVKRMVQPWVRIDRTTGWVSSEYQVLWDYQSNTGF